MILTLAGIAMSIFAWMCLRDPAINFLARHQSEPDRHRAEWIVFPTAVDAVLHRLVSLDTTLRREFAQNNRPRTARVWIRAAKRVDLKINGATVQLSPSRNWKDISNADVVDLLRTGQNVIEARVFNHTAPSALWLVLNTDELTLTTDNTWQASIAGSAWRAAAVTSTPKTPGAGNPIAGGEQTFSALKKIWPIWTGFLAIALVVCAVAIRVWRVYSQGPTGRWLQLSALLLVTSLWLILFWNNARLLPYHIGFDSPDHLAYVKYVQEHRALPLPTEGYEMYQPPLYYAIAAAALSVCGSSIDTHLSVFVLRLLNAIFGIAQFILVHLSLRLLFPTRIALQWIGLLVAAFLPMHLYLSHYVTNEMLVATLITAALYFGLRLLGSENPSMWQSVWVGLFMGAAMLTKATGILLLPILVMAIATKPFGVQRVPIGISLRNIGVMLAICFAVCGWHYMRIWLRFGIPLLGNWDVASGFAWWQEPGYHMAGDYFRFGRSLISPLFAGLAGFADGIYSTLWGDGLCGGVAGLDYRNPWNYQLMTAGYLLALFPTMIITCGVVVAVGRFVRKSSAEVVMMIGLATALLLGLVFMTLKVASYAQIKAFYELSILTPLCFFAALGWETLTRGRKLLQLVFGTIILLWAINSFASVWIVRSVPQRLCLARGLRAEAKVDMAESEATKAVQSDPTDSKARQFHALVLNDLDRNEEALKEAERAVELSPTDSATHLQLAMCAKQTEIERAISESRRAIELGPENSAAYKFLMGCLLQSHLNKEAIDLGRDWLTVSPFAADVHYALALAEAETSQLIEAASQFGYVMMLRPEFLDAHAKLRQVLLSLADRPNGLTQLREVSSAAPDSPRMLDELAWLFATHPDSNVRDGPEAVRLSERACMLTERRIPALLDTLAAADAEIGNFSTAISTAEEARKLAQTSGDVDAVALSERLLSSLRQNLPYREEPVEE